MRTVLDLLTGLILLLASPWWLIRMARRGLLHTDWPARFGLGPPLPAKHRPRILVHAVSVGEVAAAWPLVEQLQSPDGGPPFEVVVSATTDTGIARAGQLGGDGGLVVRTPYAFHASIRRWLRRCDPDVLVLMELEVWPSMLAEAHDRGIPVVVVNGRLTERSLKRYLAIRPLIAPAFRRLSACAVQDQDTARRFAAVGTPADRISVTGTMKWDRARIQDEVPGSDELASELGIDRSRPLVVAGSTSPDETRLIDEAIGDAAQLLIAPRRPEWFDGAAEALPGCTRRSRTRGGRDAGTPGPAPGSSERGGGSSERGGGPRGRFLLDSIGELRPAYCLADVVIVGRTFGRLHGSDMMEPIGLGKPVIVGPRTGDFASVMCRLLDGGGVLQVTPEELPGSLHRLLEDPSERRALAERGREVIRRRRGAAARNAAIVRSLVSPVAASGPEVPTSEPVESAASTADPPIAPEAASTPIR